MKNTPRLESVSIKPFDLRTLPRNATILVYGKRRSGKSVLVRNIMYKHRDIPSGIVISQSEETNPFYRKFIPQSYIYERYDSVRMKQIYEHQVKAVKKDSGPCPENNFFIVMDDVLSDVRAWKTDETLQRAMFNGRHANIFLVIVMQYCLALPPAIRSNFDYVFIFKDIIPANRKRLYENFAGIIGTFENFNRIMDEVTKDHGCLVIKLCGDSNSWKDCVFWLKAKIIDRTFRVGSDEYWLAHEMRCQEYSDEDEEPEEEDPVSRPMRLMLRPKSSRKINSKP
jgi:hypothetical protein